MSLLAISMIVGLVYETGITKGMLKPYEVKVSSTVLKLATASSTLTKVNPAEIFPGEQACDFSGLEKISIRIRSRTITNSAAERLSHQAQTPTRSERPLEPEYFCIPVIQKASAK